MAGGRYFKRKRRPRRHFGKLVRRKYVKRRFRKRPRRTATRQALGKPVMVFLRLFPTSLLSQKPLALTINR